MVVLWWCTSVHRLCGFPWYNCFCFYDTVHTSILVSPSPSVEKFHPFWDSWNLQGEISGISREFQKQISLQLILNLRPHNFFCTNTHNPTSHRTLKASQKSSSQASSSHAWYIWWRFSYPRRRAIPVPSFTFILFQTLVLVRMVCYKGLARRLQSIDPTVPMDSRGFATSR